MLNESDINVTDRTPHVVVGELKHQHKLLTFAEPEQLVIFADGVDNLLSYIATKMPNAQRGKSSTKKDEDDFNAFETYDEAMSTFRSHPEKVVEFNPAELRIKDDNEAGSRVDYDVVGDYIDMGRYMEGIPESWGSMHNGNARNRRVNIIINLSQLWNIKHADVTHRGERILRLVDALEAGGVRTELTGIESTQCSYTQVKLKRHDEPLTISDLAVVAHPEFLRRPLFRVVEYSKRWDYGYGNAVCYGEALDRNPQMLHSGNNDEVNIFIDGNMRGVPLIDQQFDKLEKLIVWEMSKVVPEVDAIKLNGHGVYFNANGSRPEEEIKREGLEAINAE